MKALYCANHRLFTSKFLFYYRIYDTTREEFGNVHNATGIRQQEINTSLKSSTARASNNNKILLLFNRNISSSPLVELTFLDNIDLSERVHYRQHASPSKHVCEHPCFCTCRGH